MSKPRIFITRKEAKRYFKNVVRHKLPNFNPNNGASLDWNWSIEAVKTTYDMYSGKKKEEGGFVISIEQSPPRAIADPNVYAFDLNTFSLIKTSAVWR